jgi:DNA repair protein RAD5
MSQSDGSRFFSEDSKGVKSEPQGSGNYSVPSSPQVEQLSSKQSLFVAEDESDDEDNSGENGNGGAEDGMDDYMLFESQIQAIVPDICPSMIQELYNEHNLHQEPVISAVNAYFERDTFEPAPLPPHPLVDQPLVSSSPGRSVSRLPSSQLSEKSKRRQQLQQKPIPENVIWRRFIGSLQVTGWATRPTVNPVPYGTRLAVSKSYTDSTPTKKRRLNNNTKSSYVKLIQDIDNPYKRKEIGRLPEDIASILYNLIDHEICDFDVTMVLCDGRLSTGDSFIVQLDCFLTSRIFEKYEGGNYEEDLKMMKHHSFENGAQVAPSEKVIRDRQVAMLKLFNKLNFQVMKPSEEEDEEDEVIDLEADDLDDQLKGKNSQSPESAADEMNLNQLKEFYRRTQTEKILETLPETETKSNFKLDLRSYQKQGLTWMLRSERELDNGEVGNLMNPLWKEFKWPKDRSWVVMRKESLRPRFQGQDYFYGNLYSGEFSLEKPILKNLCKGGILADEMGLGKTVSTLSLIHNVPSDKGFTHKAASEQSYAYSTTLIVVPTSLLSQWQDEFKKANNNNSSILIYYDNDRDVDLRTSLCSESPPMVVLTTYGTVQYEWSKFSRVNGMDKRGLFSVKFFRLVLDEGHNIRNRLAKTTKACYELKSSRKWLLTGTPIINRLDDLYSLIKFLELEPWANISYWNTFITVPFAKKDYKQALDVVQSILEPILLRRTKTMKKNGKALVELPPKEVVIERIKFGPREKRLYDWFLARAESSVNDGIRRGDILKKYTTILVHILRLRQICCHMDLISGGSDEMDEDISSKNLTPLDIPEELLRDSETYPINEMNIAMDKIHQLFPKVDDLECSICINQPIPSDNIAFTECGHSFCLSCILEHCNYQEMHGHKSTCPNCKADISSSKLLQPRNDLKVNESGPYSLQRYDESLRSSKMNALLSHLRNIKETCPNEKVVVFSQFSSFLDIMESEISKERGFTVFKFDGRLSFEKRKKVLEHFKKPVDTVTVLLLSLKAGGVGLNLTEASRAFMCDPWWSPSVEDQAIDRIHRIGQSNDVKVVRFIMEGSIEEKMLKIQDRKRTIGEAVEAEEEERRKRRVEEIQMLFEST